MASEELFAQLIRDEGFKRTFYQDQGGVPTIGVGHNLRDTPLSDRAVRVILEDDVMAAEDAVGHLGPWVMTLSEARRGVLVNMAFNLGEAGLRGFRRMLAAMQTGNWEQAATEMLASTWEQQVGPRAHRLAKQMRENTWQ